MVICFTLLRRRKRLVTVVATLVTLGLFVLVTMFQEDYGISLHASRLPSLIRSSRVALPESKSLCPVYPPLNETDVLLKLANVTYDDVEGELRQLLQLGPGGHYAPTECNARERVALIIPMRDRKRNLLILLRNLLPFMARQQAEFSVFLVEQTPGLLFNKGVMIDVGFVKARESGGNFTCFIVQDTDLVPRDYRNLYRCDNEGPRHLMLRRSGEMRPVEDRLPYPSFIGGAVALRKKHFEVSNGFSTAYFGWGTEDDDMERRLRAHNFSISRLPVEHGNYYELGHDLWEHGPRKKLKRTIESRMETEGLNSLNYTLVQEEQLGLYHHYLVTPPAPPSQIYANGADDERRPIKGKRKIKLKGTMKRVGKGTVKELGLW